MNHNLCHVDHTAHYERHRIRDDMRQIRLEQRATKVQDQTARSSRSQPVALQVVRHAALALAQAVLGMFA
jgi:hypothetical protein